MDPNQKSTVSKVYPQEEKKKKKKKNVHVYEPINTDASLKKIQCFWTDILALTST